MNHTYRLIWSHRSRSLVVVGEHARSCGKSVRGAALVIAAALAAAIVPVSPASAVPSGGVITHGVGNVARNDGVLTISQTTPRMAIDWASFSNAAGEKIIFSQPNRSSIVLNRVTGSGRSELMGSLEANGQVFVINPNGVLFGPAASVNVRGLLASTLNMDSKQFFDGGNVLEGSGTGNVLNQGTLKAGQGGYIVLAGPRLTNAGILSAEQGKVAMLAGDKVSLSLNNTSLVGYSIDRGSLNALVENSGTISANGGEVLLSVSAADALSRAAINHTGVIEAKTLQSQAGVIQLIGDIQAGNIQIAGKLDASAPNGGNGGSVIIKGARVNVADSTLVTTSAPSGKTGTWALDLDDSTVTRGNATTSSSISATALSNSLGLTDVQIANTNFANSTGAIHVDAEVKWDAATKLTLSASRNIYINADINATKGQLQLEYAQGGSSPDYGYFLGNGAKVYLPDGDNFLVSPGKGVGIVPYRVISKLGGQGSATENNLQGISNKVTHYVFGADIDASATYRWDGDKGDGGFVPISGFAGTLDGLGHTISNLYINNTKQEYVGLFGDLKPTGNIRNLVLENANVSNRALISTVPVGSVVGQNEGKLFNVHTRNMTVSTATGNAGGLVGNNKGEIRNSSAVGAVNVLIAKEEIQGVGGLVGTQSGTIIDSYAMAAVNGRTSTGGLVGLMTGGSVSGSYAGKSTDGYGSVVGGENTGGLIGYMKSGTVSNSYAAVPVTGANGTGGLIGRADAPIAADPEKGTPAVESKVENTYATGLVKFTGDDDKTVGGLVGSGGATVTSSFWDMQTTGQAQANSNSGLGLASSEMKNLAIFAGKGWSVDDEGGMGKVWRIYDGQTAPLLRSFLVMKEVEANSVIYNAQTQAGCTGTPCGSAAGDLPFTAASGLNAGTYAPYSTQQGYDIKGGKLTIAPLLLAPTAIAPEKTYDGTVDVLQNQLLSIKSLGNDAVTVNYASAKYDNKNASDNRTVNFSGITLGGASAGNYEIADTFAVGNAKIAKRVLTLSDTKVADKVYDGNTTATLINAGTLANTVGNDQVTVSAASAAFADKSASAGKQVTVSGVALGGNDKDNYSIVDTAKATASITRRALTLSDTKVADKVYDGNTTATLTNAGTLANTVGGDQVTVSAASAAFADKNAGVGKAVTLSRLALTGADAANYVMDSSQIATATIQPRPLAIRAQGVDKTYDGTTNATVTLGDNRIEGDQLDLRYARASFADGTAGGNKAVTATGIAASGVDAGNYVIDSTAAATAGISKAPLTITANPDNRTFDGKAYRGGNGVTYAGFVAGENAVVLSGQPSYGGDAQGAVNVGSYHIAPAGYASQNYAFVYVDGKLTIQPPAAEPVYQAVGAVVAATAAVMSDAATKPEGMRLLSQQATLRITECGTRLPEQLLAAVVDCNEARASTKASSSAMSASGL